MILFFGKQGQLAKSFQATVPEALKESSVFISSQEANFENPNHLEGFLDHYGPEIVVICSAYTQVDKAEEEKELAEVINVKAPQVIARWCHTNDRLLIHFSTDYVFSGAGSTPWKEEDPKAPLSWYGVTKLEGEEAIRNSFCSHLIFRTSWVYSEYGKNFLKTMLKLGKEKDALRVVNDQIGSPTYAGDISEAVWSLILRSRSGEKLPSGIYHLAGTGTTSWAQFAEQIFEECRVVKRELKIQKIEGIPTSEYPTVATRPLNSRLDQSKLEKIFGLVMPPWRESLKLCLKRMES